MIAMHLERIERKIDHVAALLAKLVQGEITMAQTLDSLIVALNSNTNVVAGKLDAVRLELAALKAAGSPPTQAQLDSLQSVVDHLAAMGTDPANPVPDVPAAIAAPAPTPA